MAASAPSPAAPLHGKTAAQSLLLLLLLLLLPLLLLSSADQPTGVHCWSRSAVHPGPTAGTVLKRFDATKLYTLACQVRPTLLLLCCLA